MTLSARRTPIGVRDLPFILLVATVVGIQVLTVANTALHERLLSALGVSWSDLAAGRVWRLLTSSLVQTESGVRPGIMFLLSLAVLGAMFRIEPRRAVPLWFFGDAVASIVMALGYRLVVGAGVGSWGSRLVLRDGGSSSGAHALMTAAVLTLNSRRKRFVGVSALVLAQIPFIAITHNTAYVHHLVAITVTVIAFEVLGREPQ